MMFFPDIATVLVPSIHWEEWWFQNGEAPNTLIKEEAEHKDTITSLYATLQTGHITTTQPFA